MKSVDPIVTERRKVREAPGPHFVRVAKMWSAVLGIEVTPIQVIQCMVQLKLGREAGQHDPDNLADAQGYMSLIPEVKAYLEEFDMPLMARVVRDCYNPPNPNTGD